MSSKNPKSQDDFWDELSCSPHSSLENRQIISAPPTASISVYVCQHRTIAGWENTWISSLLGYPMTWVKIPRVSNLEHQLIRRWSLLRGHLWHCFSAFSYFAKTRNLFWRFPQPPSLPSNPRLSLCIYFIVFHLDISFEPDEPRLWMGRRQQAAWAYNSASPS